MIENVNFVRSNVHSLEIPEFDHFVYACVDVDASAMEFAQVSGVMPTFAGVHPDFNTKMYLARVGEKAYLEFTGLDRTKPLPSWAPFGLLDLPKSRLVAWSIRVDDLPSAVDSALRIGVDYGEIRDLRRERPDGSLLEWQLASPNPKPFDGVGPFLIDWGDSAHPSLDAEVGLDLVDFSSTHPSPGSVNGLLNLFGISMSVVEGPPLLSCVLHSESGYVRLA